MLHGPGTQCQVRAGCAAYVKWFAAHEQQLLYGKEREPCVWHELRAFVIQSMENRTMWNEYNNVVNVRVITAYPQCINV